MNQYNGYLEAAVNRKTEIIKLRRCLHQCPEIGFELDQTFSYVWERLKEYGLSPKKAGRSGIVCTLGKSGKTILLRADMDALPMREESGLPFAALNGNCHSCGHDCHTAMLLAAAKLLKEREGELKGTVKLMFQPAEELLSGAKDMIDYGILENPKVDAAFSLHVMTGSEDAKTGVLRYPVGTVNSSGDAVRITVTGMDAHGSKSYKGIDAIHIAAHIVIALEEVVAREIPSDEDAVLLVGKIEGGTTCNSVAGTAMLELSIRASNQEQRDFLLNRVEAVAKGIAGTFRGEAHAERLYGCPALVNDGEMIERVAGYLRELLPEEKVVQMGKLGGGEDFTMVAERVPSAFLVLGAGSPKEGYSHDLHHPEMRINEEALPIGTAAYAYCAARWLEEQE